MKKMFALACLLLSLLLLSGCFLTPNAAPVPAPPTFFAPEPEPFVTVPVTRGDIILDAVILARYVPTRVVNHYFELSGVPILGIFVSVGDEVVQGDIIAALDIPEIQAELEYLNRRRARLVLESALLSERQALEYRLKPDSPAAEQLAAAVSDMRLELETLDRLIAHVSELNEARYLRAVMDGIVSFSHRFDENMYSTSGRTVVGISVFISSSFVVQGTWAIGMYPGDQVEVDFGGELFTMKVVDPYETRLHELERPAPEVTSAYLEFVGVRPDIYFDADTVGSIHILIDQAIDVLVIPSAALRQVEDRSFVYVLDENGLRAIRHVATGIEDDSYVEIMSGLTEGELIIL